MLDDLRRLQNPVQGQAPPPLTLQRALGNLKNFQTRMESKIRGTKDVGTLKKLFGVASTVVTAYHTDKQVDTDRPQCGADKPKLDEIYNDISDGLAFASAALTTVPYGQVAAILAGVASVAVGAFGQRHQSHSNCAYAVALIPSCINDINQLRIDAWVGQNQNPMANGQVNVRGDNWWGYKHVDFPEIHPAPADFTIPSTDPEHPGVRVCRYNLLGVQLRNWNNCENLQLYFKAYWDAPMPANCDHECIDFSMVSELYRDSWLFEPLDENIQSALTRYYGDQLRNAEHYKNSTDPT